MLLLALVICMLKPEISDYYRIFLIAFFVVTSIILLVAARLFLNKLNQSMPDAYQRSKKMIMCYTTWISIFMFLRAGDMALDYVNEKIFDDEDDQLKEIVDYTLISFYFIEMVPPFLIISILFKMTQKRTKEYSLNPDSQSVRLSLTSEMLSRSQTGGTGDDGGNNNTDPNKVSAEIGKKSKKKPGIASLSINRKDSFGSDEDMKDEDDQYKESIYKGVPLKQDSIRPTAFEPRRQNTNMGADPHMFKKSYTDNLGG